MAQLELFNSQDGIELVIDGNTGEAFATQAGYVRMSGKAKMTISDRIKGVRDEEVKTAEILTAGGLQGVRLISAKLCFKWLIKDNPELAEKMGEVGATVYIHQLAGYKVSSAIAQTEPAQAALPQTYIEALEALLESEKEKERLRLQNELQASQIGILEADNEHLSELTDELFNYSSIIRIAKLNGVNERAYKWHSLKAATKMAKMEVKRVPCPRFGEKLLYPHQAWTIAYPDAELPKNPQIGLTLID